MTDEHGPEVLAIYQAGLDTGNASFETRAPDWSRWTAGHLPAHRFVATEADRVLGWVAVSATSARPVYAGVVELSIYLAPDAQGRGIASVLLAELINSTEAAGIWTLQTGIFPENTASLELHRRAGFRVIGVRERIGQHQGRWRDVTFLERRSPTVD
jgi:phosphinothricin acetyltransferase